MSEKVEEQILKTRSMSQDNSLVTYDLTKGVDFSHPRKTAEAFAKVFLENDASKWFAITDGEVDFHPSYKALVLVDESDNREVDKTMKDFFKDVEFDETSQRFFKLMDKKNTAHFGISYSLSPWMLASAFQVQDISDDELIVEVLDDIKRNTEIRDISKK